jgi:peptidyl-dipeptidase A
MGTLLHEFGHAVYDNELDPSLPYFLKTVSHIMTTEAIAELMGRFVNNGAWLKRWANAKPEDAEEIASSAQRAQRIHLLVFTQWVRVLMHFEQELYRDPIQDLDRLWWDMVARFQRLTPPENALPAAWASKIHLSTSPVYYHNYLMGEMIGSQLLNFLRTNIVDGDEDLVTSPKVGAWLVEKFFRPGARFMWNDLVAHATGEPVNPRYFINELRANA